MKSYKNISKNRDGTCQDSGGSIIPIPNNVSLEKNVISSVDLTNELLELTERAYLLDNTYFIQKQKTASNVALIERDIFMKRKQVKFLIELLRMKNE